MELLDRYLQAVKKHLPWQRQEDIVAELRANLESQLDEKQADLGRPLTPAEAEAWMRQLGSPVQMAAHYQPQQYLIGPAIYPVYLYVLRLSSMWAIVIYILVSTITIVVGSPDAKAVADAAMRLPLILIQVAAWITLAFAALEFIAARYPEKCPSIAGFHAQWSPSNLPPLEPAVAAGKKRRSYAHAVTEVIFGFIFLIWLLLVPRYPYLMFGPGAAILHASRFRIAPVWLTYYWWIVGLNAIQLAWRCIDLLRGAWRQPDRYQHLVVKIFGLIPLLLLLNVHDHQYVLLRHPEVDQLQNGATVDSLNSAIHLGLAAVCTIIVLQLAWDIGRGVLDIARTRAAAR